jgi:hypothetical protein
VSEKRSVRRALLLLLARSSRLISTRHDTSRRARTPRFAELRLRAELIFLLHRKTECLTESLTDASQRVGSGRSRILGCCNRLGRATWAWPTLSRVSLLRARAYINSCPATAANILNRSRVFGTSRCLRRLCSLLIPSAGVHRRMGEQVSETTHLCDPVWERAN